jgi:hypothetical protein
MAIGASMVLLTGCTMHPSSTRPTGSGSSSSDGTNDATPSGAPDTAPSSTPSTSSSGTPSARSSTTDAAQALDLARRACTYVAKGFSAAAVAQATPVAKQAAALDGTWRRIASNLDFMNKNPVNPDTGAGPPQSGEMASGVADDCSSLAGVAVSRD